MLFKKLIDIFGFNINNDTWHILEKVADLCNFCFYEISLRSFNIAICTLQIYSHSLCYISNLAVIITVNGCTHDTQ